MIEVISRTPNDDRFTFDLFRELCEGCDRPHLAYYLWTNPPDIFENFMNSMDFGRSPNVILGIKDSLCMWKDFNYWHDHAQHGVELLDHTAAKWPNTNFVIFTSLENLQRERISSANLQIIPWGGDITNQIRDYEKLEPVLDKDFNSQHTFISLNRNVRDHRIMLLSYLYGADLSQHGHISFLQGENIDYSKIKTNLLDRSFWEFTMPRHSRFRDVMIQGYQMISHNQSLVTDDYEIYHKGKVNDNISNFNARLRPLYQKSFVEIVTESMYSAPSFHVTEKTWHVFAGCNFPIFISGPGAVRHLRSLGLDLFDDVVNHDYDLIDNPIDRMIAAIELNRGLLTETDAVKEIWEINQQRFIDNLSVLRTLAHKYRQRARDLWQQIKWKNQ